MACPFARATASFLRGTRIRACARCSSLPRRGGPRGVHWLARCQRESAVGMRRQPQRLSARWPAAREKSCRRLIYPPARIFNSASGGLWGRSSWGGHGVTGKWHRRWGTRKPFARSGARAAPIRSPCWCPAIALWLRIRAWAGFRAVWTGNAPCCGARESSGSSPRHARLASARNRGPAVHLPRFWAASAEDADAFGP
jgi:hypothetical protein